MDSRPEFGSVACKALAAGPRGSALAVFLSSYGEDSGVKERTVKLVTLRVRGAERRGVGFNTQSS